MTGHTHAPSALHPAQPRRQANAVAGSRPDSTARGRPADAAPQHQSVAARAARRAAAGTGPAAQAHAPSCARHTRSSASRGGLGGAAVPSPLLRRLACAPGTGSRACPPSACAPLRWPGAAACLQGSHARQPRGSSRTHEPALFGANARLTADPTHPLPPWQRWTAAPSGRCPPAALVRCRNELARRDQWPRQHSQRHACAAPHSQAGMCVQHAAAAAQAHLHRGRVGQRRGRSPLHAELGAALRPLQPAAAVAVRPGAGRGAGALRQRTAPALKHACAARRVSCKRSRCHRHAPLAALQPLAARGHPLTAPKQGHFAGTSACGAGQACMGGTRVLRAQQAGWHQSRHRMSNASGRGFSVAVAGRGSSGPGRTGGGRWRTSAGRAAAAPGRCRQWTAAGTRPACPAASWWC